MFLCNFYDVALMTWENLQKKLRMTRDKFIKLVFFIIDECNAPILYLDYEIFNEDEE